MQLLATSEILNRMIAAFSWMLIHSLWQGIVLALVTGILMTLTKKWPAFARYNMVLAFFAGFLFISIFTFLWELNNVYGRNTNGSFAIMSAAHIPRFFFGGMETMRQLLNKISLYCTEHATVIAMIWFIIFGTRIIKIQGALIYNNRIKNRQIVQPNLYWRNRMNTLRSLLNIRKAVVLFESGYMKVPVVIGHLKPVILMPLGLLTSLPAEQVEAILLHELAHIRRNDYLVNIFQHITETVFFFNPAVLWVSSWLKEERENCCDDIVLAQTQNKEGLVEALISFKQHELYGSFYETAFPGRKDYLLRRIGHILGNNNTTAALPVKIFYGVAFILLLAGAATIILSQGTRPVAAKKIRESGKVSSPLSKVIIVEIKPRIYKKVVGTAGQTAIEKGHTVFAPKQSDEKQEAFLSDAQMAAENKEQAMKDEVTAKLDAEKAFRDQQNGMIDENKAKKDQKQAMINQYNAKLAQHKAMQDQLRAKADADMADLNQENALRNKKEAEKIKMQNQSLQ